MPNQGNKSNGNSGVVKPKKDTTKASTKKQDAEQSNGSNSQKGESGSKKSSGNGK